MNTITLHPSGRLSFGEVRKNFKPRFVPAFSTRRKMMEESISAIGASAYADLVGKPLASMDLSNLSNSEKISQPKTRAKRGSKGMTGYGRLLVKDAAYWLQAEYGKERLAFWTVTIPPDCLTEELVSQWSRVTDLLRRKLIYHLEKHDLPKFIVGVTEVQPERWKRDEGVPPLHLHILFVAGHKPFVPLLSKTLLAKIWGATLENFSGKAPNLDTISNVSFIRKDAVGYLGKYMSKGGSKDAPLPPHLVPSSWYFCTNDLRVVVKALTTKHSGEWVNELYQYFRVNTYMFRFTKAVEIEFGDGHKLKVGWYGDLKPECFDTAWETIRDTASTFKAIVTLK
jgi:hypothetical protein